MKKRILITGILIAVLLMAGGFFVVQKKIKTPVGQNRNQVQNAEIESVKDLVDGEYKFENVDTNGWQTYGNTKYGFEIKYPKDWEIQENSSSEGEKYVAINFNQKNARDVAEGLKEGSVVIYVSTDKTKEPILTELKRLKKEYNASIWKTSVDGLEGYYFRGFGEGLRMNVGDYDFSITSSLTSEKTDRDDQIRNVLNGMIQMLHFAK